MAKGEGIMGRDVQGECGAVAAKFNDDLGIGEKAEAKAAQVGGSGEADEAEHEGAFLEIGLSAEIANGPAMDAALLGELEPFGVSAAAHARGSRRGVAGVAFGAMAAKQFAVGEGLKEWSILRVGDVVV